MLTQHLLLFENFTHAHLFQIALEIMWLPIGINFKACSCNFIYFYYFIIFRLFLFFFFTVCVLWHFTAVFCLDPYGSTLYIKYFVATLTSTLVGQHSTALLNIILASSGPSSPTAAFQILTELGICSSAGKKKVLNRYVCLLLLTKLGGCWYMGQEFASLTSWLLYANRWFPSCLLPLLQSKKYTQNN